MNLVTRAREIGGRWILLMKSLLSMILLNLELVLLAKNLYNCKTKFCHYYYCYKGRVKESNYTQCCVIIFNFVPVSCQSIIKITKRLNRLT